MENRIHLPVAVANNGIGSLIVTRGGPAGEARQNESDCIVMPIKDIGLRSRSDRQKPCIDVKPPHSCRICTKFPCDSARFLLASRPVARKRRRHRGTGGLQAGERKERECGRTNRVCLFLISRLFLPPLARSLQEG